MKWLAMALIRAYQMLISPLIGPMSPCRFTPSCSNYALQAIQKHGVLYGGWLAAKRLVKCGPWCSQCGPDEVP